MDDPEDIPLLCHRCGATLTPGKGNFYMVRILAVADPSPPVIDEEDLDGDIQAEVDRLLEELRGTSEREAADQVFRRLTVHLCTPCYQQWIENPTG